jgi:5-methylcytosine-specific restriction endonuclease McrA
MLKQKDVNKLLVAERKKAKAKITTKATIAKLLVEERKKSRISQRESKFKQRTLTIYKHQVERAAEFKITVGYTLEDFREFVRSALEKGTCYYCGSRITVAGFVADHKNPIARGGSFSRENLAVCCAPCNFRKGTLTSSEFNRLSQFLQAEFPTEVVSDIWKRLTIGGKWAGRLFS